MADLAEPFLLNHLNPIFLHVFKSIWQEVESSQVIEELKTETQLNLTRFLFRRLFQPLYLRYPPEISGSIFFVSRIHEDGLGDFIALLRSAKILKEARPLLDIQVAYEYKKKLPNIHLEDYLLQEKQIYSFYEPDDFSVLESVLEGKDDNSIESKLSNLLEESEQQKKDQKALKDRWGYVVSSLIEISEETDHEIRTLNALLDRRERAKILYSKMKQSLAIVHISLGLNTFDNPHLSLKSLYFAEAGNFPGIGNYLKRNWSGMGLQPFEEGIFTQKAGASHPEWEDSWLPKFLWKAFQPHPQTIEDYRKNHTLHLGYFSRSRIQQQIFIYLICLSQRTDSRHIDIVLSKTQLAHFPSIDSDFLSTLGIAKVIAVDPVNGEVEVWACNFKNEAKKVLRLICVLPLPIDDFQKLIGMSGKIMGCTGDGSLSDCIACDKIPFYELRSHKLETWNAIHSIAQFLKLDTVDLYLQEVSNFLKDKPEDIALKIYPILKDDAFEQEWILLVDFIRKYYCFEDALQEHLNRHFYKMKNLEVIEKEELLIQKYWRGKMTAQEAFTEFENVLSSNRLK